jgi:hypothetical protein
MFLFIFAEKNRYDSYIHRYKYLTLFFLPAQVQKQNHGLPLKKKTIFTWKLDLNFKELISEVLHLQQAMYGAETWTIRKFD